MNAKHPFLSRGFWGQVLQIIGLVFGLFSLDFSAEEQRMIIDGIGLAYTVLIEVAGIILGIYGRAKANLPLSWKAPLLPK